jgi:hypothetical protein
MAATRTKPGGQDVMTRSRPHPAGILVVANRTCPCPLLLDEVARRASDAPIDVLVVVPALNSRLRHWLSDIDDALARAHARLGVALADLRTRGVNARGEVETRTRWWRSMTRWRTSPPRRS